MRTLIIILAVIALFYILKHLSKSNPQAYKQLLRNGLIAVAVVVFLFLLLTGRMHWLFAAIAAAVPVVLRLARYFPMFHGLFKRYQAGKAGAGVSGGQRSTVQSGFFSMQLDLDSGEMDGEVLQGRFQGKKLSQLQLSQLLQLLSECQHDQDSLALLAAYLDRAHPDWREQVSTGQYEQTQQAGNSGGGSMSRREAYEVLGLAQDAGEQEIISAHKRLMQKIHPDLGGSTYLAAKINQAKQVLLG